MAFMDPYSPLLPAGKSIQNTQNRSLHTSRERYANHSCTFWWLGDKEWVWQVNRYRLKKAGLRMILPLKFLKAKRRLAFPQSPQARDSRKNTSYQQCHLWNGENTTVGSKSRGQSLTGRFLCEPDTGLVF
jgi:hypothetical protein